MKDIIPAKKESPILGLSGMGGGVGSNLGGSLEDPTYVEDVFSTDVWDGDGAAHRVVNGIDIAGEGGMVWTKCRTTTYGNLIADTVRGYNYAAFSDGHSTDGPNDNYFKAFHDDGFTTGDWVGANQSGQNFAGWTFRKQKGFFDVVTWTGNATNSSASPRQIAHSLGSVPGAIWIKCTSANQSWACYHTSLGATRYMHLNDNGAGGTSQAWWNNIEPTSTHFTLWYDGQVNETGHTYVAYIFGGGQSADTGAHSIFYPSASGQVRRILCGDASNKTADFNFGTGDLTIECWIKCSGTQGGYPRVVAIGPQWEAEMAAIQWDHTETANRVTFYCYNHSSSTSAPLLQSAIKGFNNDGQYHHVAVSRNGNIWRLFVDGILEDTETWTGSPTTADSYCTIGNTPGSATTAWFGGYISNVRIVKGTAVYTSSFRVPSEPLKNITNTKLLCCNNLSGTAATVTPITLTETNIIQNQTNNPFDDPEGFKFGEEGDQNLIKCGTYRGNGSNDGPEVNIGWEPQWFLIKNASSANTEWLLFDSTRGVIAHPYSEANIRPNLQDAEWGNEYLSPTSTGFKITNGPSTWVNQNTAQYIYVAIRTSDGAVGKPPEAGTEAFAMATGNSSNTIPDFDSGFPVEFSLLRQPGTTESWYIQARITGPTHLFANSHTAESAMATWTFDSSVGWSKNGNNSNYQSWMRKRGAGVEVLTYTGNGLTPHEIPHNLGKAPEMMWVKSRTTTGKDWAVYHKGLNGGVTPWNYKMRLDHADGERSNSYYFGGEPTARSFTVNGSDLNANGERTIAYLFSSVAGISKVGSYTGSDSAQTITTGFQPRFVIIKCYTEDSRNWLVFDTLRGWASGNDKELNLNTNSAQNNMYDFGAPTSTGFTINAVNRDINVSGQTYVYYAHA